MRNVPISDDGDELRFCSTCAFSSACLEQGYDKSRLADLHVLVNHVGFAPRGAKIGLISGDKVTPFTVIDTASGRAVKQGEMAVHGGEIGRASCRERV